jgi:drug/metabolite transporter (DMT)-like permease
VTAGAPASRARALLALTVCCLFWGLGFPLMKALVLRAELLAPGVSTWFVSSFVIGARFAVGALLLLVLGPRRPTRSELVQGLWLGAPAGVGIVLQADGLAHTEASTSAFLTQGYVFLLPIITALSARRWPRRRVVFCALLSVLGLGVLSRFDPTTFALGRGESETLLAALCFTFQILALDAPRFTGNRTGPMTNVMFLSVAAISAPVALATLRGPADVLAVVGSGPSLLLFALLVVLCTLGAFVLMNRYQSTLSASEAGIIYGLEPVFASLFALWLPELMSPPLGIVYGDELLSARLLCGGGLVVAATLGLSLFGGGAAQPASSSETALASRS